MEDGKLKPIVSMAMLKIKKKEPEEEASFEKEGLRAAAEQMMIALKRLDRCELMPYDVDEKLEKRDDESDEEFALRAKEEVVRKKAREEKRDIYIDAFMEALCDFIEMKYDIEPKDNKEEY